MVFVAGVRSRCPCSGVWLLALTRYSKCQLNFREVLERGRRLDRELVGIKFWRLSSGHGNV